MNEYRNLSVILYLSLTFLIVESFSFYLQGSDKEDFAEIYPMGRHWQVQAIEQHPVIQQLEIDDEKLLEVIHEPVIQLEKNHNFIEVLSRRIPPNQEILRNLQADPLLIFKECLASDCPMNRVKAPEIRQSFEKVVLGSVSAHQSYYEETHMRLSFFGSGALFDTLIHLLQISQYCSFEELEIDLIDPVYKNITNAYKASQKSSIGFIEVGDNNHDNLKISAHNLRFALLDKILKKVFPESYITLRIYKSLKDLSEDLSEKITTTPCHIMVGGDLFDGITEVAAIPQARLVKYGALSMDTNSSILTLSRNSKNSFSKKPCVITTYVKNKSRRASKYSTEAIDQIMSKKERSAGKKLTELEKIHIYPPILAGDFSIETKHCGKEKHPTPPYNFSLFGAMFMVGVGMWYMY